MRLIGMLDSPYVRRVAIGLRALGLRFTHEPISVFRQMEAFAAINPVIKVPTLVTDAGTVLMDSSLILDHAEQCAGRSLWPPALPARERALRIVGLALAASDKSKELIYEQRLRPEARRHAPWIERVSAQLRAAFAQLEAELAADPPHAGAPLTHAGIGAAVAWHFTQQVAPQALAPGAHPQLAAWSAAAEALPAFRAAPYGEAAMAACASGR